MSVLVHLSSWHSGQLQSHTVSHRCRQTNCKNWGVEWKLATAPHGRWKRDEMINTQWKIEKFVTQNFDVGIFDFLPTWNPAVVYSWRGSMLACVSWAGRVDLMLTSHQYVYFTVMLATCQQSNHFLHNLSPTETIWSIDVLEQDSWFPPLVNADGAVTMTTQG